MKREDFINVVEETLDSLPEEFRSRIQNVAILVEDYPPNQSPGRQRRLLLGIFHGVPATQRASLTYQSVLPTSCSIRKTLKRYAPMRQKFVIKFVRLSYMNLVIISA